MSSRCARLDAHFSNPSKSKNSAASSPSTKEKGKSIVVDTGRPKLPLALAKKPSTLVIGGSTAIATSKKLAQASTDLKRKATNHPDDSRPPKMVKLRMDYTNEDRMGRGP